MQHHVASNRDVLSNLDVYLDNIRDARLLNADEERELAGKIAAGDKTARNRLIQANLRLVVKIARSYQGRGLAIDDLIAEGNIGLIRAVEDFDPKFGARFSTYAGYWIKQAIRQALTTTARTIRLPSHVVNLMSRWRAAERDLRRHRGVDPSVDEVCDFLELTESHRELVRHALRACRLRSEGANFDGDDSQLSELAADPTDGVEAAYETRDELADVLRRLDHLEPRERAIVRMRFGLDGEEPMTLKQVGDRVGLTREWVRKLEEKALVKLDNRHLTDSTVQANEAASPAPLRPRRRGASARLDRTRSPVRSSNPDYSDPRGATRRTERENREQSLAHSEQYEMVFVHV